ncbi:hypothetical protein [Streptomyces sp. NPDC048639]|uniref:hypothetical protein n=1 Tax=Streptomyces sp. NPDC048639 TaxID=3365581 RepID=UPI0037248880
MKYTKAAAVVVGSVMALGTGSAAVADDGPPASARTPMGQTALLKDQPLGDVKNPAEKPLNGLLSVITTPLQGGQRMDPRMVDNDIRKSVLEQVGQGHDAAANPSTGMMGGSQFAGGQGGQGQGGLGGLGGNGGLLGGLPVAG